MPRRRAACFLEQSHREATFAPRRPEPRSESRRSCPGRASYAGTCGSRSQGAGWFPESRSPGLLDCWGGSSVSLPGVREPGVCRRPSLCWTSASSPGTVWIRHRARVRTEEEVESVEDRVGAIERALTAPRPAPASRPAAEGFPALPGLDHGALAEARIAGSPKLNSGCFRSSPPWKER